MFDKEKFKTRLKQLRESHPQYNTQKEFSDFIEVSQPTLAGYERGTGKPPIDVLCNIAEKCNVSVDWLCGMSDIHTNIDRALTYNQICEVIACMREKYGLSIEVFSKDNPDPTFLFDTSSGKLPVAMTVWDGIMSLFMQEWEPIFGAFNNGSIKETYYRMIMDDIISKYNIRLNDDTEYTQFISKWKDSQDF